MNNLRILCTLLISMVIRFSIDAQIQSGMPSTKSEILKPDLSSIDLVPAAFITVGAYSIHHYTDQTGLPYGTGAINMPPDFNTRADDILQFAPIAAGFGIGVFDEKQAHPGIPSASS